MKDLATATIAQKKLFAFLAILAIPLSGLSVDIYVPSLPAVANYFHVDKSIVQVSISSYVFGMGIMQLIVGSISDAFGRLKPYIIASILFLIVSIAIPFSPDINTLIFLRFVQGIAVAGLTVPTRAIVSDLFTGAEFHKMMNYITIAWALGPIIAPVIGGYLQHYFNWRAPFYFLSLYGLITFLLILIKVPETCQKYMPFSLNHIFKSYVMILRNKEYDLGLFVLGILYSMLILFGMVGPFIVQVVMQYSAVDFGHLALMMGLGWFLGNLTNRLMIKINFTTKVLTCLIILWILTGLMTCLAAYYPLNHINAVLLFFTLFFAAIIFPNYYTRCIGLFPNLAATANALMGGAMFLIGGLNSLIGATLKANTEMPLMLTYFMMVTVAGFLFFIGGKQKGTLPAQEYYME